MTLGQPFCNHCGAANNTPLPMQGNYTPAPAIPGSEAASASPQLRPRDVQPPYFSRYAPLSTGAFFGMFLLMCVPAVNLILLIVWSCGGAKNSNRRSFSRALLLCLICLCVFVLLLFLVPGLLDGLSVLAKTVFRH